MDDNNGAADATITDAQLPTVGITANDASASEVGHATGQFTLSRKSGEANTDPITVSILISGSAKNGKDYNTIAKSYTIPSGSDTKTITITPKTDTLVEGPESVVLSLGKGNFNIDTNHSSDTVTIADAQKPTVSVVAVDTPVLETDTTGARLRLWRTGQNSSSSVTVSFALDGTATATTDYTIVDENGNTLDLSDTSNVSATIAAGRSFIDIYVIPVDDGQIGTDDKTVSVTVNTDSSYTVDGVLNSDSITITGV